MSKSDTTWQDWFSNTILLRGYEYYESGRVTKIDKTISGYSAIVEGSMSYNVEIEMTGDDFADANCSCPYASDGKYCKHEAAVLYSIMEMKIENDSPSFNDIDAELDKIINNMDEKDVRDLLFSIAKNNSSVRKKIYLDYDASVSENLMKDIKKSAGKYIRGLNKKYNYYNEDRLWSITTEFIHFISEEIEELLYKKKCCYEVFCLSFDIYKEIPFGDLTDLDCSIYLENSLRDLMSEAYNLSNDRVKAEIVKIAKDKMDTYYILKEFLIYTVKDRVIAEKELQRLKSKTYKAEWEIPYYQIISLMEILEYSEDEIISYMKENSDVWGIRKRLVHRLYSNGRWRECIDLILSSKDMYGTYDEEIELLKKIYREHNMIDELKSYLINNVKTCTQYNLSNIKELEKILDKKEWEELCSSLKNLHSLDSIRSTFLVYIEDWESLMDYMEKSENHWHEDYYEKLASLYPDRVVAVYEKRAKTVEKYMGNRDEYSLYAYWLDRMRITKSGKDQARKMAEDVKIEYPRHRALHDELRKIGL